MDSLVPLYNFVTNSTNFLNFVLLVELEIATDKLRFKLCCQTVD